MHLIFFISYWLCSKNVFQEVWVQITTQKYPIPVISVWLLRHFWLQYHIGLSRGWRHRAYSVCKFFPLAPPSSQLLSVSASSLPTPLSSLLLSVCCCWGFFFLHCCCSLHNFLNFSGGKCTFIRPRLMDSDEDDAVFSLFWEVHATWIHASLVKL